MVIFLQQRGAAPALAGDVTAGAVLEYNPIDPPAFAGPLELVGSSTLVMLTSGVLSVFDISTTTDPDYIARVDLTATVPTNYGNAGYAVDGTTLWGIGTDAGTTYLYAFDLTTPTSPTFVAGSQLAIDSSAGGLISAGAGVLAAHGNSSTDAVYVYDVSTPGSPSAATVSNATTLSNAEGLVYLGGGYVLAQMTQRVTSVDISTPGSPTIDDSLVVGGLISIGAAPGLLGSNVYCNYFNTVVSVDVSNPSSLVLDDTLATGTDSTLRGLHGQGSHVFGARIASGEDQLDIIDVSTPTSISSAATYTNGGAGGVGDFYTNVSGALWATITAYGLVIYDMSTPTAPTVHGFHLWSAPSGTFGMSPPDAGRVALPAAVVDLTTGRGLVAIASTGTIRDLVLDGDYVYAIDSTNDAVRVYDVSTPPFGVQVGQYLDAVNLNDPRRCVLVGTTLWVAAAGTDRITGVSIATPASPSLVGSVTDATINLDTGSANGLAYDGADHLYVASAADDRITAIDISTPGAPTVADDIVDADLLANPEHLVVDGTHLYVTSSGLPSSFPTNLPGSLTAIDISTPTAMSIADAVQTSDNGDVDDVLFVAVIGDYLYAVGAGGRDRIVTFNIATPTALALTGVFDDPASPTLNELRADGTQLYAATTVAGVIRTYVPT